MSKKAKLVRENFLRVGERVAQAAVMAGRNADDITIVGVTKYVDANIARMLVDAGCQNIGESRPQVLEEKATSLADLDVIWHLIGHLQRNKVAKTLQHAKMIHSVDSIRLAKAIDRLAGEKFAGKQNRTVKVLLEVNVSGDPAKQGFDVSEILDSALEISDLENLSVHGLMCMAGLASDEQETRQQFASLRELRDELQTRLPADHQFHDLSMGMSADFELAIAEGATIVRIGSMLFKGLS